MKRILLPLTGSYNLAFELMYKVHKALEGLDGYQMYVRPHPTMKKGILEKFAKDNSIHNYQFAIGGNIQSWFDGTEAVISTGLTITVLEAVAFGIPVIRLIPDNTFHYDMFPTAVELDYPLTPISSPEDIRKQLKKITEIKISGNELWLKFLKKGDKMKKENLAQKLRERSVERHWTWEEMAKIAEEWYQKHPEELKEWE